LFIITIKCFLFTATEIERIEMLKCSLANESTMKLEYDPKIRMAEDKDASIVDELITDWLKFDVDREVSIRRAIENRELLVAEYKGEEL